MAPSADSRFHPGAVQLHPGVVQLHPGVAQLHPGVVQLHPGVVQAFRPALGCPTEESRAAPRMNSRGKTLSPARADDLRVDSAPVNAGARNRDGLGPIAALGRQSGSTRPEACEGVLPSDASHASSTRRRPRSLGRALDSRSHWLRTREDRSIPGFPGNWCRYQFPDPGASNSGESRWQKALPPDRVAAIMPASGGWFPSASGGAPGGWPAIEAVHRCEVSGTMKYTNDGPRD